MTDYQEMCLYGVCALVAAPLVMPPIYSNIKNIARVLEEAKKIRAEIDREQARKELSDKI